MTYQETVDFLFSQLPMYQRDGKQAFKKDLSNTKDLLRFLGDPQEKIKTFHIAGTNGKGTSAHSIAAILQLSGYKTGLYTSPHLKDFTERIKINGQEIEQEAVISFVRRISPLMDQIRPSFFEITVAMAFDYFNSENVDIAVIETGLGGRLDSTNVITKPEATLITNIGFDHVDMLGDTLDKIATEKAGIIKHSRPTIIGTYHPETFPVFQEKCQSVGSNLTLASQAPLTISHSSQSWSYQKRLNYHSILSSIEVLRTEGYQISKSNFEKGMLGMEKITGLKGRFQVLQDDPMIVADVSHNKEGLTYLFREILQIIQKTGGDLHLIFGTVKDKDLSGILKTIPKESNLYLSQAKVPRALAISDLAIQFQQLSIPILDTFVDVNEGVETIEKSLNRQDVLLICGSTFLVAELQNL